MPPVYWIPIGFAVFTTFAVIFVELYTRWYYRNHKCEEIKDVGSPPNKLRKILPYSMHCKLGLHNPSMIIQSVTHEPKEDICLDCGKVLAVYKMIKVKPKRGLR